LPVTTGQMNDVIMHVVVHLDNASMYVDCMPNACCTSVKG